MERRCTRLMFAEDARGQRTIVRCFGGDGDHRRVKEGGRVRFKLSNEVVLAGFGPEEVFELGRRVVDESVYVGEGSEEEIVYWRRLGYVEDGRKSVNCVDCRRERILSQGESTD